MAKLPTGTVTFVCAALGPALDEEAATALLKSGKGVVFGSKPRAVRAAFARPADALQAALELGRADPTCCVALHGGRAEPLGGAYVGTTLSRALALLAAAHSGQILVSQTAHELLTEQLPANAKLQELGTYRLKDLTRPKTIYQLAAPGLANQFPPLDTLDSRPTNLPIQPTPMIGREEEIRTGCALLSDPEIRLVTLLGASGTGKTRLALQVAVEMLDSFKDGVYFVSLAPVSDPLVVLSTIVQVLGAKETSDRSLLETLSQHLGDAEMLLVIDNFEQVLEAAPFLADLVSATSGLKLMVTSQMELDLPQEHLLLLPPLATPDPANLPALDQLIQFPAIALFVERARSAQPSFELTAANAPAVVELCARLAGLPLAIELAAAHSARLFPEDMLVMLKGRLQLGGRRSRNSREHTLRHVLDWSFNLIRPEDQTLFSRLGVFEGGCTLEAAEAVCNAIGAGELPVLEGMETLLEAHLLLQEELAESHLRYVMLDAIHEYAGRQLARSGEADQLRTAHLVYYLALAEDAEPALKGSQQEAWLARLEGEHHNLRAALRWAQEQGNYESGVRLAAALRRFWYLHGHISEGRRWYDTLLAHAGSVSEMARAGAYHGAGMLAYAQADYPAATAAYETSLALRRAEGNVAGIAALLNNLGIIAGNRGKYDEARERYEECLDLWRSTGDPVGISGILNNLGALAYNQGDFEAATRFYTEALVLKRSSGEVSGIGLVLGNLGRIAYNLEDYRQAREYLDEAVGCCREIGNNVSLGDTLTSLGRLTLAEGNPSLAAEQLREALMVRHAMGNRRGIAFSLEALAMLYARTGAAALAARLFGRAEAIRASLGVPLPEPDRPDYNAAQERLRQLLEPEELATQWAAGAVLPVDEAVDEALNG